MTVESRHNELLFNQQDQRNKRAFKLYPNAEQAASHQINKNQTVRLKFL